MAQILEPTQKAIEEYAKQGYGHGHEHLTEKDIKALLDGKVLAIFDGEYTQTFSIIGFCQDCGNYSIEYNRPEGKQMKYQQKICKLGIVGVERYFRCDKYVGIEKGDEG